MTRPVTAQDRERGEEDSVLSILKQIDEECREWVTKGGFLDLQCTLSDICDLAREAIAQIEAMSTLDGQRSYGLWIAEKRKGLEQQTADLGRWPGDPPQSDSDFTEGT